MNSGRDSTGLRSNRIILAAWAVVITAGVTGALLLQTLHANRQQRINDLLRRTNQLESGTIFHPGGEEVNFVKVSRYFVRSEASE